MIFMKFFARSSRATGPKMRVPFGLPSGPMMTMALLSKAQVAAVGAANRGLGANDDRFRDLALLHRGVRGAFLDVDRHDVADAGAIGVLALLADHRGPAGAGVVRDLEDALAGLTVGYHGIERTPGRKPDLARATGGRSLRKVLELIGFDPPKRRRDADGEPVRT